MADKDVLIQNRINKVNSIALGEVGYTEKKTNITKYAIEFDTKYKGFYYGQSNPCEWCDLFFDWCMVASFGMELAEKMLYQPKKSYGRSCSWSYNYYRDNYAIGDSPKEGAQVFFKNTKTGKICHTGRVIKVFEKNKKKYIQTVEGNKNNSVCICEYPVNSKKIYGYGYPNYGVDISTNNGTNNNSAINGTYKVIAKSGLRVREKATTESKTIRVLGFGTIVSGIDKGDWIKIKDGYIYKKYTIKVKE